MQADEIIMRTRSKFGFAALAVVLLSGAAFVCFIVYPEQAKLEASAGQGNLTGILDRAN